jgi:hypothetical protein
MAGRRETSDHLRELSESSLEGPALEQIGRPGFQFQ